MVTMLYSVVIQRREDTKPQPLMLMKKINMKKIYPLHIMSRKEMVREKSFMIGNTKVEYQVLFRIKIRKERIFHTSYVTIVVNMKTMSVIVIVQTK